MLRRPGRLSFFFFNDTATTEIYTLSLHDALRICDGPASARLLDVGHVALAQHAEPDVRVEGLRQVLEHEAGPLLQAERRAAGAADQPQRQPDAVVAVVGAFEDLPGGQLADEAVRGREGEDRKSTR